MRSDRYKEEPVDVKKKQKRGPLRALLVFILLLAAAIAGTTAYSYYNAYNSLDVDFTEKSPVLEFGESYPAMDYVKRAVGDITADADVIDTSVTGEGQVTFTVEKSVLGGLFNPSKDYILNYSVVDSVPPLKIWGGDGTVLQRGSEFDINEIIAYGDNADPTPLVTVDGKVNMEKNGNYPLHVKVTDASGNRTEWDLTVSVADEIKPYNYSFDKRKFRDFVKENKGKGRSFGIDISAWQDEVDFKAVKKAGCEFVIIRIGYTYDGDLKIDKDFYQNYEGARAAGLKTGVYLYSADRTEEQVRASAQWIMDTLGGDSLDLPVAFDWEDFDNYQDYDISFYELNGLYDAFADELSKSGYGCMLYGSKNYLEKVWKKTDVRPVWLAHYTQKTDYKGPFMLWQASCAGKISGIKGDVDMDILYNY